MKVENIVKWQSIVKWHSKEDWAQLKECLLSDPDPSFKIIVATFFELYHPNEAVRKCYGLSSWQDRLRPYAIHPYKPKQGDDGAVSLADLLYAHYLVKSYEETLGEITPAALDEVSTRIKNYIQNNIKILKPILQHAETTEALKEELLKSLEDLSINRVNRVEEELLQHYQTHQAARSASPKFFDLDHPPKIITSPPETTTKATQRFHII